MLNEIVGISLEETPLSLNSLKNPRLLSPLIVFSITSGFVLTILSTISSKFFFLFMYHRQG